MLLDESREGGSILRQLGASAEGGVRTLMTSMSFLLRTLPWAALYTEEISRRLNSDICRDVVRSWQVVDGLGDPRHAACRPGVSPQGMCTPCIWAVSGKTSGCGQVACGRGCKWDSQVATSASKRASIYGNSAVRRDCEATRHQLSKY